MAGFVVEYAKSGRSACKHCKLELAKGEVRIGIVSKGAGFAMTKWHHSKCVLELQAPVADVLKAKGFAALKASDQTILKELLQREAVEVSRKKICLEKKAVVPKETRQLWHAKLSSFEPSQFSTCYKDSSLPMGWKSFSSIIVNTPDDSGTLSEKVAAFDFDGCLVNTDVKRVGAQAWSLLYTSIPQKLQACHEDGYKLVVFTNESNIDRWTKSRQKAIDSKLGRLNAFMDLVKVPIQVVISCGLDGDPCRKPAPGMWEFMERHLNGDIAIDRSMSFYVGDAAGRAGDHSDADIGFAKAVGLKFFVPEDYFDVKQKTSLID
ncbi:polynucleotide 3'-phosphatase ZDP [Selaginella moellendorffii]|nr:polynucleotide 3'-phosphatase ZDP [Selaginella moellendorffii]|eukprot:XP_002971818.2 polynucleotide 3'-phosphatase ZDP [Selaginella moellendorffii]